MVCGSHDAHRHFMGRQGRCAIRPEASTKTLPRRAMHYPVHATAAWCRQSLRPPGLQQRCHGSQHHHTAVCDPHLAAPTPRPSYVIPHRKLASGRASHAEPARSPQERGMAEQCAPSSPESDLHSHNCAHRFQGALTISSELIARKRRRKRATRRPECLSRGRHPRRQVKAPPTRDARDSDARRQDWTHTQ